MKKLKNIMTENNFAKKTLPEIQKKHPNRRLFRNNSGAYIIDGRFVTYGIGLLRRSKSGKSKTPKGGGDYIGFESVIITPEMIGKKIAVFCNVEFKTKNVDETQDQIDFRNLVLESGGISEVYKEE